MAAEFPDVAISREAPPVVQSLMRLFRLGHMRLWNELQDLTAEQMDWRPTPQADSIGMIIDHVITAEAGLIDMVFFGQPPDRPTPDQSVRLGSHQWRWGRETCQRSEVPAAAYLADLAHEYRRGIAALARLTDEQLAETSHPLWPDQCISLEEWTHHMVEHLAHHKGQIVYITIMEGFPGA